MSFTETDTQYEDEILRLAKDPDLNKEKGKTSKLISIIKNFPVAERAVSRLCQLSLSILQTLEKIELNLKNWTFMSLDLNSANHFDNSNPEEIKTFNNNVSMRVITSCQELTVKLNKISSDVDFITKASRSLSPHEYLSDSGTLLTSLTLRNIKLKDELREKVTIAYSKAKLITIGTNLESMLEGGSAEQRSTVSSYKKFVVSLLMQLNNAIEAQDDEEKNECLAVISDMEQMFEAFKLEFAQTVSEDVKSPASFDSEVFPQELTAESYSESDDLFDSALSSHTTTSSHLQPIVHSITKSSEPTIVESRRRGSFSSVASTSILQKSTLSEELPYLMSAFNSAKTLEEDVHHFKEEEQEQNKPQKEKQETSSIPINTTQRHFPTTKNHLPKSLLYSDSQILSTPKIPSPSFLYSNNSLLSKLGIKPQVISTTLPKQLADNMNSNKHLGLMAKSAPQLRTEVATHEKTKENKENESYMLPLTRANLDSHNLVALSPDNEQLDFSTDFVE